MIKRQWKSWLSIGVSILLLCSSVSAMAAVELDADETFSSNSWSRLATVVQKNEVVYGNLSADGTVQGLYVVNHFEVSQAGTISDYGSYDSVTNLTDLKELEYSDGMVIAPLAEKDYYYQGNLTTTDIPWNIDISYTMDGKTYSPQEIAGKSGKLEMRIQTAQNHKIDETFYENYMLQISVTLDTQSAADIRAEGATVASAGKNTVLAFTVMPQSDADLTITATVRDFEMSGIEISALPFSMDVDLGDTDEMVDEFAQLADGIAQLNDGVGELSDGAAQMETGAKGLKDGSAEIHTGLGKLSGNSGQLLDASSQINSALQQISSALGGDFSEGLDLESFTQLAGGLSQMSGGLKEMSGGLKQLKFGYGEAHTALDGAIQAIPAPTVTEQQIQELYANADPGQHETIGKLVESYQAAQTVKGTYGYVKEAFTAVNSTLDEVTGGIDEITASLDQMALAIDSAMSGVDITEQLSQLEKGLSELAANYGSFHTGLQEYMGGIQGLSQGYSTFHSGVGSFSDGMGEFSNGTGELHNGTSELAQETASLPDILKKEIDAMVADYTGGDFDPVSFTSDKNENINLVQFVFTTEPITAEAEETEEPVEEKSLSFWDRFTALFS